jgi:LacI family transcriptional regulator
MTNATIDDVAVLAGVSIKTVSRVVNHESNVRDATREKVEKAIAELNYRPNPSARSLAGNRSFLLGLIYGAPGAHYVLDIQGGILDVCRPLGYELIVHPADSRDENVVDDVIALIKEKRVDAVMLTPPLSDNLDVIKHLIKMKIAFVRVAPTQEKNSSPYVETNDVDAAYDMTQQLISLGHSRIGFVCGHPDHKAVYSRYDGYLQALQENGIPLDKKLVAFGNNHFESGVACGEKLLDLPEPPTAIFAANDDMAAGVMMVAHQRGVAIPTELSVAGYDDTPVAQQLWPSLSTVRQPILQMARKATDLLLKSVRGKEVSMQGIMLASSVIVRDSIAVCAKKNQ